MKAIKVDHCGAKNGGGYWGLRVDAKRISKKLRRKNWKAEIKTLQLGPPDKIDMPDGG